MSSSSLVGAEIDVESLPEAVRGYEYKRHLQSGAFGSVWHAQGPSCGHVAVKVQRKQLHMLAHENDMLSTLAPHPHIVRPLVHATCDGAAALVTELCDHDLLSCIAEAKRLPQHRAMRIFRQVLKAVRHMHGSGIYHCDLKPENVLLAGETAKIADFGASSKGCVFTARNLGSAQYLCPELLTWREGQEVNMGASDVWSLGVMLFTMLAGYQPWGQPTLSDIHFSQFVAGTMRFPSALSAEAVDLILAMLSLDPLDRPTASDLLKSPLLAEGCPVDGSVVHESVRLQVTAASGSDHAAPPSPTADTRAADMDRCGSGESKDSGASSSPGRSPRACDVKHASTSAFHTPAAVRRRPWMFSVNCNDDDDDMSDDEECPYAVSPKVPAHVFVDEDVAME